MPTSLTSTGITFPDASVQTTAAGIPRTVVAYNASGTFVVPAGVTTLYVLAIGGGQGGGTGSDYVNGTSYTAAVQAIPGANGGTGGTLFKILSTSAGTSYSFTIGAGGAAGAVGSNTVFNTTLVAAGAGRGSSAGGDTMDMNIEGLIGNFFNLTNGATSTPGVQLQLCSTRIIKTTGNSAASVYSVGSSFGPGAGGSGQRNLGAGSALGGVGGAVILAY